jgi:hypothetical protein
VPEDTHSFVWKYWGCPAAILGFILMPLMGAAATVIMPIAGTLVVVLWIVYAIGRSTGEQQARPKVPDTQSVPSGKAPNVNIAAQTGFPWRP